MTRVSGAALLMLAACYPATTRPAFGPVPRAAVMELELDIPEATRSVAIALDADSLPVHRTEPRDGWLETEWFDANTLKPTGSRRLGAGVVKLRAWVDPSRPNHSNITIETVFRPLADPSREGRELERQVDSTSAISRRVKRLLNDLATKYGGIPDTTVKQ